MCSVRSGIGNVFVMHSSGYKGKGLDDAIQRGFASPGFSHDSVRFTYLTLVACSRYISKLHTLQIFSG